MKRIFTLVFLATLIFGKLMAGNFAVVAPSTVNGWVEINVAQEFAIYISNTTAPAGNLFLSWNKIDLTLESDTTWKYTICDKGQCYNGIPSIVCNMDTVKPTQSGYFLLTVTAHTLGTRVLRLLVYETGTTTPADTVVFSIKCSGTGVQETASPTTGFSIYPNPAKDFVGLKMKDVNAKVKTATVFDILGNVVMTFNNDGRTDFSRINILPLQTGVYVMKMQDQEGRISSRRFYKSN